MSLSRDILGCWIVAALTLAACEGTEAVDGDIDAGTFPGETLTSWYTNVPGGAFMMGCDSSSEPDCDLHPDARPDHEVWLDDFMIRITEVSQRDYQSCLEAGACTPPSANFDPVNPVYDGTPVRNVTWEQAAQYCEWADGFLPTEAQWEKAARGFCSASYPWGNDPPDCTLAQYADCGAGPIDVGELHGYCLTADVRIVARQMAGNVSEWVSDYYDPSYYENSPAENPPGPATGTKRSARGGSFRDAGPELRTWVRREAAEADDVGFRCVRPSWFGEP